MDPFKPGIDPDILVPFRRLQEAQTKAFNAITMPTIRGLDTMELLRKQIQPAIGLHSSAMFQWADQISKYPTLPLSSAVSEAIERIARPEWMQRLVDYSNSSLNLWQQVSESFAAQGFRSDRIHTPAFLEISRNAARQQAMGELIDDKLLIFLSVYDTVAFLETRLRRVVAHAMASKYSENHEAELPSKVRKSSEAFRAKNARHANLDLYQFMSVRDVQSVIRKAWIPVFQALFNDWKQPDLFEVLETFASGRDDAAHLRAFSVFQFSNFSINAFVLEDIIYRAEGRDRDSEEVDNV